MILKILIFSLAAWQAAALQNGTQVAQGVFPSFVAVFTPLNRQICGGAILNENHAVTLTSCLLNPTTGFTLIAASQVSILAGQNSINFELPRMQALALYVHQQYNPFTFDNDIAVIRTVNSFVFQNIAIPLVAPVAIADFIAWDTMNCNLAAWNLNNNQLQTLATHPILNRDVCTELPVNFGRITERMFCAGTVAAGPGVCEPNIGAALYCNGMLQGLLNSGFGCGVANNPGVYIQVRFFAEWIDEQIRRQDIPAAFSFPLERLP
jgi:trypsin